MFNMRQISSLTATAEGPVAEFSSFANFEARKRKSNLLMSFQKIVNQMGSFGQVRKNSIFRFCRLILDIFGFTLFIWCKRSGHRKYLTQSNINSMVAGFMSLHVLIKTPLCNFTRMPFFLDTICKFSLCRFLDPKVLGASGSILQFHEYPTGQDWL